MPQGVPDPRLTERAAHCLSLADLRAGLDATEAGLSGAEAARRLAAVGPNELQAATRVSPWRLLAAQFKNVLILILLAATAVSFSLGHVLEATAIAVIVLFAALLGFVQEYRAERAIESLRRMAAPTATALRDGEETTVPAREIVPGDLIILRTGDRAPADARLVQVVNLQVQEALLTGESVPVVKRLAELPGTDLALGDRVNMVYAGTVVTYGRGRALVTATGMATEFGRIARLLESVETGRTPLQENLDRLGRSLARAALALVALIVVVGLLRGQPFVDLLIFGVALAVAVVPEALPAVVTISLAIGVQRLARRKALMRRLPAIETLGSTSVICSDKTGTLTRDEMTVRALHVDGRHLEVTGAGYRPQGEFLEAGVPVADHAALDRLLRAAALGSDAYLVHSEDEDHWRVKGDPTEGALVVAAAKAGMRKLDLDDRFPRLEEIPFSSESKRMTTLHQMADGPVAFVKGAPEVVLDACARRQSADGDQALDQDGRRRILEAAGTMAAQAMRVLAVADKGGTDCLDQAQGGLTFLGLVGMIDPPRPEANEAIRTCEAAGIRVLMMTGDHPATAEAVARELGLLKNGRVVTGTQLEAMSPEAFALEVEGIDVYARVSPEHKLRVVTALQDKGHVVAMTGDGVNDAPALKKAEIGVAMGVSGTDVAREAAAMMLTDDNFASIVAAVEEGRGIFDNILKYLGFLLSSNIGEIGLVAGAALLGLPMPLTAVQILYVNLATDGLPALALAVDPPDSELMRRGPRRPRSGVFGRPAVAMILIGGLWSSIVNLALFAWALRSGRPLPLAMTMTFAALVLIQFCNAYNFRSDRRSVLRRPFANRWLNRAVGWELALLLLVLNLPFLQRPLGIQVLTPRDWFVVAVAAGTVLPVMEAAKGFRRRGLLGSEG